MSQRICITCEELAAKGFQPSSHQSGGISGMIPDPINTGSVGPRTSFRSSNVQPMNSNVRPTINSNVQLSFNQPSVEDVYTFQSRPRDKQSCPPCDKRQRVELNPNEVLNLDEGFPEQLGEPTFEELQAACTPIFSCNTTSPCEPEQPVPEEDLSQFEPEEVMEEPSINQEEATISDDRLSPTYTKDSNLLPTMDSEMKYPRAHTSHAPDGAGDKHPVWDGVPMNPTGKSNSELCAFLKPEGIRSKGVKGIMELYNQVKPFADETNPTVDEFEKWGLESIRHIRRLLGMDAPVIGDARLFLESRWSDERKYTNMWDSQYPEGTCPQGSGAHCGWMFFPSPDDRAPYIAAQPYNNDFEKYPMLDPVTYLRPWAQSEGISGVGVKTPLSLVIPLVIANWVCGEGRVGHAGPFVNPQPRKYFGFSIRNTADGISVRIRSR